MSAVKVKIITRANFRNEVHVDGKFVYESFLHHHIEARNLKALISALAIENIEVIDNEEKK